MTFLLLLFLSVPCQAQDASTDTVKDDSPALSSSLEVSNLNKGQFLLMKGRYTQTGKPTFRNGFCFGDSTCQTTAATTATVVSSKTLVANASITQTSFINCYATVTLTNMPAGRAWVYANITIRNGTSGNATSLTYMIDGAFPSESGSTVTGNTPLIESEADVANWNEPLNFIIDTPSLSAGTHSFCLTVKVNAGTSLIASRINTFGAHAP